jgi:hypothetical protein
MEWIADSYTTVPADAAGGFTGRGWNWESRLWETMTLRNLARSRLTSFRLRCFHVFVRAVGTLGIKKGVIGALYVVADPMATDFMIRLPATELQGGHGVISYVGDYPMLSGIVSRFNIGAVDAGDIIDTFVGYDHG